MATAAFKSTSKRGNQNPIANTSNSHSVRKRSQSVCAISRTKQTVDISSEFSNRRENPLFWTSNSTISRPADDQESNGIGKRTDKDKRVVESNAKTALGISITDAERGRSVTRNSGVKNGIGRSLSRVRRRSLSRGPNGASESEKEQGMTALTNTQYSGVRLANNSKLVNRIRNGADVQRQIKDPRTTGSLCQATECSEDDSVCSFQFSNWEDGVSTCSLSEAEERTIKAVYEQMKVDQAGGDAATNGIYETVRSEVRRAISDIQNDIESAIRRSNANGVAVTDTADVPADMFNSRPVESVLDSRREYARKLEESEERARKLKADLAVEVHRGQEFSRKLKETLPDPQTSNPQKSRIGRKRSTERKKMSKHLMEEAMTYFDECVSISTFDSSDFSASEDPPHTSDGSSIPISGALSTPQGTLSMNLALYNPDSFSINKKTLNGHMQRCEDSNLSVNSIYNALSVDQDGQVNNNRVSNQRHQFSFAQQKPKENVGSKNSIQSYIEHFQRGINENAEGSVNTKSDYNADNCSLHGCLESFLLDRVFFSKRLESGSLQLCSGSIAVSFSPFGSVL